MNLYLRYFDSEILVKTVNEALDFLASIPEIGLNDALAADLCEYVASDVMYPKRYKVRARIYFIVIKTTAESMEDFKAKKALAPKPEPKADKTRFVQHYSEIREGWYNCVMEFKRVVMQPQTTKCEYVDTHVEYNLKAVSGQDCYNRIIDYLRDRVDRRSQFPSIKGKNFRFTYLGKWK